MGIEFVMGVAVGALGAHGAGKGGAMPHDATIPGCDDVFRWRLILPGAVVQTPCDVLGEAF
jgi:hypothetical protein